MGWAAAWRRRWRDGGGGEDYDDDGECGGGWCGAFPNLTRNPRQLGGPSTIPNAVILLCFCMRLLPQEEEEDEVADTYIHPHPTRPSFLPRARQCLHVRT